MRGERREKVRRRRRLHGTTCEKGQERWQKLSVVNEMAEQKTDRSDLTAVTWFSSFATFAPLHPQASSNARPSCVVAWPLDIAEALGYLGVLASQLVTLHPWWRHGIEGMELIRNRVRKIIGFIDL